MKLKTIKNVRLGACLTMIAGLLLGQSMLTMFAFMVFAWTFMSTIERIERLILAPLDDQDEEENKEDQEKG